MLKSIGLIAVFAVTSTSFGGVMAQAQGNGPAVTLPPPLSPELNPSGSYTVSTLFMRGGDVVLSTSMFDWRDGSVFVLTLDKDQRLRSSVIADQYINFESREPKRIPIQFSFVPRHSVATLNYQSKPQDQATARSDYGLPLAEAIASSPVEQTGLDPSFLRENVLCESGEFILWYRMPAEAVFFGYPIRATIALSRSSRYKQLYTHLVGKQRNFARLRHPKPFSEADGAGDLNEQPLSPEAYLACFVDAQPASWAAELRQRFNAAYLNFQNDVGKDVTEEEVKIRELYLLSAMHETCKRFDQMLQDGHSIFLDPFMRGLMLEQTFWYPRDHRITMTHQVGAMLDDLKNRGGTLSYSLCCAYADLGCAPNITSQFNLINAAHTDVFPDHHAAAILARWRWPTEDYHVAATMEHMATTPHVTERFDCVETMILMDEIDQVPPNLLEDWFERRVVDADDPQRRLNLLMQNTKGRRYLAEKYASRVSESSFWKQVQDLFANEINAVNQLGDYRFFSKEECDQLSAVLGLDT